MDSLESFNYFSIFTFAALCILQGILQPLKQLLVAEFLITFNTPNLGLTLRSGLFLALFTFSVVYFATLYPREIASNLAKELQHRYFCHVFKQEASIREKESIEFRMGIMRNIDQIEASIAVFGQVIQNIVVFVAGLTLALYSSIELSITILCTFPVVGLILHGMHNRVSINHKIESDSYKAASDISFQILTFITTVMAFNRQQFEIDRYKSHLIKARRAKEKTVLIAGFGWGMYLCVMFLTFSIAFFVAGYYISKGKLNAGQAINCFSQIAVGVTALGNIGQSRASLSMAFDNLIEIKSLLSKPQDNDDGIEIEIENIEFRNVWFKYPSGSEYILENVSFQLSRGKIGLVGKSGSGKSTIFQLILKIYSPQKGNIYVNGLDISKIKASCIRKQISANLQNSCLFYGTIIENITLGREISASQVVDVCKLVQAHDFILNSGGYSALIEPWQHSFSGGQVQRLLLARTIVGSSIILLDESTSALDANQELAILNSIFSTKKLVVFSSHRKECLDLADQILEVKNKKVVSIESFNESGVYVPENTLTPSVDSVLDDRKTEIVMNFETDPVIYKYVKQSRFFIIIGLIGGILDSLQFPLQGYIIGNVIGGFTTNQVFETTKFWALMIAFLGIGCLFSCMMYQTGLGYATASMIQSFRGDLFSSIVKADLEFIKQREYDPAIVQIMLEKDVNLLENVSLNLWADYLRLVFPLFLGIYIAISRSWKQSLFVFCCFPPLILWVYLSSRHKKYQSNIFDGELKTFRSFLSHCLGNVNTILSIGKVAYFNQIFERLLLNVGASKSAINKLNALDSGIMEGAIIVIYTCCLYFAGTLIETGTSVTQVLVSFVALGTTCLNAFGILNSIQHTRGYSRPAFDRVCIILKYIPRISLDAGISIPITRIEFNNVEFSFPNSKVPILRHVSFSIGSGQHLVITGKSGSGKSSIAALLQKHYLVSSGLILLDNLSIDLVNTRNLRNQIGIVSQRSDFFQTTAKDCIAYSNPVATIQEMELCAESADCLSFIEQRGGFDKDLGPNAQLLSGGQRQRLAIARMLLYKPSIIILDEATSAIDQESAISILSAIKKYRIQNNAIQITITHDPKLINDATIVLDLDLPK